MAGSRRLRVCCIYVFVAFIYYAYIYCVLSLVKYYIAGSGKSSGEYY